MHRKLTEQERDRMLDMAACGPLGYKPEIDDALMELGIIQWYDEEVGVAVERNTDVPLFDRSGRMLPEWYDLGKPGEAVEIEIDFKCRFHIVQLGCQSREEAVEDALNEWVRIRDTIGYTLDYVRIVDISEPVVK